MEVFLIVLLVFVLAAGLGIALQDKKPTLSKSRKQTKTAKKTTFTKQSFRQESSKKQSFKEIVADTFPKYKVTEKNGQTIIYEINHRNEPDELVYIRLGQEKKEIKLSGRILIAQYAQQPTPAEMRRDFWNLD